MGILDNVFTQQKQKAEDKLNIPEYAQEVKPPKPSEKYAQEVVPVSITNADLAEGLRQLAKELKKFRADVLNNQALIYSLLTPEEKSVVLNKEELKYIPEEDKEEYMQLKKDNPNKAKIFLEGYKAQKK